MLASIRSSDSTTSGRSSQHTVFTRPPPAQDTDPDPAEFAARNAADIAWMQHAFSEATAKGSSALMLISQADPGFDATDATRSPLRDAKTLVETDGQPDGFHDFLVALRTPTIEFRKPVPANRTAVPAHNAWRIAPRPTSTGRGLRQRLPQTAPRPRR
jgi:hypothetical protein